MSGISVLFSILDKLEELRYSTSDNEGYFILRYEYLKDIPGKQLYDTLIKLQEDKFIIFKLDETIYDGIYLNKKGRPIPCSQYFKIKLLDGFYPYYIKNKKELKEEQLLDEKSEQKSKFKLSKRQLEVLQLYSDGYKTREEIAAVMEIKPTTVRTHEEEIMKKLETGTIQQSIKVAVKNNLIN